MYCFENSAKRKNHKLGKHLDIVISSNYNEIEAFELSLKDSNLYKQI